MYDFFISYSHEDSIWRAWLCEELEKLDKTVTHDRKDFRPAFSLVGEIEHSLQVAERAILVISPDYFKSSWCVKEWSDLFRRHRIGETGRILPIVVRDVEIPEAMSGIIHASFVGLDLEEQRVELQSALHKIEQERQSIQHAPVPGPDVRSPLLPPVCNLPHTRNPSFTGRFSELSELDVSLQSGHPTVITQAVTGLGGVGKSELVLEFAYRNSDKYSL